jgi:hypothetical protein
MALVRADPARQPDPTDPTDAEVDEQLKHHMERLAEAEHDGWMDYRLKNGWKRGEPRDDDKGIHPALVPYSDLPEHEKNKDRNTIRHFPDFVRQAGFRIVWLKPGASDTPPGAAPP